MRSPVMTSLDWLLLLVLSLLWGGSFFFVGVALKELPPLTLVIGRVALAALVLQLAVRLMGLAMPREAPVWRDFAVMGLLNNLVPFSLITWGQTSIPSGLASILNATTPLFTILLAHLLTDERMTGRRLAGVLFGIAGVAVMLGPAALQAFDQGVLGQLAVLAAACSYGFAGLWGRRFKALPPLVPAAGQVSCSALILLLPALLIDRPWTLPLPGVATIGAVLGIALLSTALAYAIFFRVLASAGATNLALVTLLIPVSALVLGSLFLGERLEAHALAGMALIFAGLAVIDGRLLRLAGIRPSIS